MDLETILTADDSFVLIAGAVSVIVLLFIDTFEALMVASVIVVLVLLRIMLLLRIESLSLVIIVDAFGSLVNVLILYLQFIHYWVILSLQMTILSIQIML